MIPHSAIDVVRPVFTDPKGLRDLLVRDATLESWTALLRWLTTAGWRQAFWIDGHEAPAPTTAAQVFAVREDDRTPILSIEINGAFANCHFWNEREIELDVRSRDFQTDERLSELVEFALGLSRGLGEQVMLTEDNTHDSVLVVFRPDRSVEPGYVRPG